MTFADSATNRERACPDCAETIKVAAKVCRYCGYRFPEIGVKPSEIASPTIAQIGRGGDTDGDIGKPAGISIWSFMGIIGAASVGVLALAVISGPADAPAEANDQVPTLKNGEPDEITAVSVCDMAAKDALLSKSSYDPEFAWTFSTKGTVASVSRKFSSQNAFGVKMDSRYSCKWDAVRDAIVSLEIVDPYGETRKVI